MTSDTHLLRDHRQRSPDVAVVIDSGPVIATDTVRDVPPEKWADLVSARRMFCAVNIPYDCRELLRFVTESEEMLHPLGYHDVSDFVRRGLDLDPEMVQWALQGLKSLKPDETVPFEKAVAHLLRDGCWREFHSRR